METFQFYKDEKMTIWYRGKFEVEANSEEEAIEMVKELEKTNKLDNYDVYWEILDDSRHLLHTAAYTSPPPILITSVVRSWIPWYNCALKLVVWV